MYKTGYKNNNQNIYSFNSLNPERNYQNKNNKVSVDSNSSTLWINSPFQKKNGDQNNKKVTNIYNNGYKYQKIQQQPRNDYFGNNNY